MPACPLHPARVRMLHVQGFNLKNLKHLVLDEADKLLDMDFEQEIDQILKVSVRPGLNMRACTCTLRPSCMCNGAC